MDPMTVSLFVELIAKVGLPLALQVRQWYVEGRQQTTVTDADIAVLVALEKYRSSDSLAAAGISIVDGKVVPIPPA